MTNVSYTSRGSTMPRLSNTEDWWRVKDGTMRVAAQESLGFYVDGVQRHTLQSETTLWASFAV
jgi:hypothetical protein